MRALVLDFDGVICDSAREGLLVSLRTYLELRPGSKLSPEAVELEAALGGAGTDPGAVARLAAFMALMPLGNRAEDYGVTWAILEADAQVHDQADYDAFYAGTEPAWRSAFHRRFYEIRHALTASHPREWHQLHRPYLHLVDLLRRRVGEVPFAIATAKDSASVHALLTAYGLDDLFDSELVLDKETGVDKRAHLTCLRNRLDIPFEELTFVDDKLNHLDAVASLGVRGVLAGWGYNGPRERDLARARGFAVAAVQDAESVLFIPRAAGKG